MSAVSISHPTRTIQASITLPASKSISNRALIMQYFNPGITLHNLSEADDTLIMQQALRQRADIIDIKNAGTCMRFLTALFASTDSEVILQGDERMKQRPIKPLVDALAQLGAGISYMEQDGYPPLKIKGHRLAGGPIRINASQSSQYVSAILLAAPYFINDSEIILEDGIVSRSYIDMTIGLMQQAGIDMQQQGNRINVKTGNYTAADLTIEPDWSAASYWYEIAALSNGCEIQLKGLRLKSLQGDAIISAYMQHFGVRTVETPQGITLKKETTGQLVPVQFDMSSTPDLVPALAVTAAALQTESRFGHIAHLTLKETDRISALAKELSGCGASVTASVEGLHISPQQLKQPSSPIITYGDHRMAMSFAPLALQFGQVIVDNPGVVHKSYPGFWKDLEQAGFILQYV